MSSLQWWSNAASMELISNQWWLTTDRQFPKNPILAKYAGVSRRLNSMLWSMKSKEDSLFYTDSSHGEASMDLGRYPCDIRPEQLLMRVSKRQQIRWQLCTEISLHVTDTWDQWSLCLFKSTRTFTDSLTQKPNRIGQVNSPANPFEIASWSLLQYHRK